DTRRRAEAILAEVSPRASVRQVREAIGQLARQADTGLEGLPTTEPTPAGQVDPTSVKPGQRVLVRHLDQAGTVLSEPTSQGVVEIQLRVGKTRVPVDALAPLPASSGLSEPAAVGGVTWRAGAGDSLVAEINVIGCTVDEATTRVQRYVEDAALGGLTQIRIIHGKGTGRLRRGIAGFLKTHPLVGGFHLASFEEGGAGATIVDLGKREDRESSSGEAASQDI
ncbi:MAG TPA: Smr/MutS family protein, partial [Candidatus Methylomirabilis sp.]|nr:Smr/MutS family protein [Candidatus Methylomirabilis sp.]